MDIFSVKTTFFTVLDYPMSYLEFAGTLFNLLSVYLIVRRNLWTWPVGIIGVILFMLLFYQIQLYSDTIEQVYYLGASVYGWWLWGRAPRDEAHGGKVEGVTFSPPRNIVITATVTGVLSLLAGWLLSRIHVMLPTLFKEPASFPFWDAATTVMSFVAMWLMARKRTECWVYWLVVDVIGVGLYWIKGVKFVALLYVLFLFLAAEGLREWRQAERRAKEEGATENAPAAPESR